jgi:DNA-binding PadR family transcriptional regulator
MSSVRRPTRDRAGTPAPEAHLPLGVPTLRILLALGDERLHGYAMLQRLEQESDGRDAMLPGTLYSTLAKMLDAGLVEEVASERQDDDARRRYYHVTPLGQEVARAEALRLERVVTLARKRKLLPAVGGEEGG